MAADVDAGSSGAVPVPGSAAASGSATASGSAADQGFRAPAPERHCGMNSSSAASSPTGFRSARFCSVGTGSVGSGSVVRFASRPAAPGAARRRRCRALSPCSGVCSAVVSSALVRCPLDCSALGVPASTASSPEVSAFRSATASAPAPCGARSRRDVRRVRFRAGAAPCPPRAASRSNQGDTTRPITAPIATVTALQQNIAPGWGPTTAKGPAPSPPRASTASSVAPAPVSAPRMTANTAPDRIAPSTREPMRRENQSST